MDVNIYKHDDFFKKGKLDISTYQKPSNKNIFLFGTDASLWAKYLTIVREKVHYMDLYIYKHYDFFKKGKLEIST